MKELFCKKCGMPMQCQLCEADPPAARPPVSEPEQSNSQYKRLVAMGAPNPEQRRDQAASEGPELAERLRIVCLCGSTRFIEQFATATWVLERQGYIALGCTLLPMWFCGVASHFGEVTGTKEQCDEHHKRKIDLADEVLVLDIGGYIGESTRSEIEYATAHGKPVRYASEEPELLQSILPAAALRSPTPRGGNKEREV